MNDELPVAVSSGAASAGLSRIVDVIESLHRDHTVSFIAAGDEKIFAYGGNGYVAVVSERLFEDAVDIDTPSLKFRVERDESGQLRAVSATGGEEPTERDLADAADGFERYYSRRIGRV